ncbi:cloacin immunity family protein [Yersinia enterocolitica]|uniref:cloacin immunity family protein n=1 Tax=Yersinia enterocolitica TaxID=630 RepID=UPI0021E79DC6|nr:cloacin immunity family protein [Yersinia enterocolitica]EKN3948187.1 cloacin [Yersinia enterocolitica]EKN6318500.1 cloacin [Yersinia enterocolitica]UXD27035.1 Colicin E6 immunity protein [Yersinia enterocolitica]UYJ97278.1 cloacin immunity family protein [Yersinia enterocolitica]HDL7912629.1 cloacin [Yersinia enterocolitica]
MGLKLHLDWFDKKTELCKGEEYSADLQSDGSVIEQLGLQIENNINNGGFDIEEYWIPILQKYFFHQINTSEYDYQISFDYRDEW